ncbi:hypothetical protein [Rhabdochlamydiaceae symbiont of Dictyostelium giganteum]|uniref:hypothetical protein n=1 Tax=Rhabdochlamydiaceae symbiont of Dictyostelium giganteum TaxID=3342349 RepID=UPI00384CF382
MTIRPRSPQEEISSSDTFESSYKKVREDHSSSHHELMSTITQVGQQAITSLQESENPSSLEDHVVSSLALDDPTLSLEQIKTIPLSEWIKAIHKSPDQSTLYSNTARRLLEETHVLLSSTEILSKEDLLERAITLDPFNISAVYHALMHKDLSQSLETDGVLQKQYIDAQMKNPYLSLEKVYAIPKELWILAIQEHPQEPILYLHLARRVEIGEEVLLKDHRKMTWHELYVESIRLKEDDVKGYIFLAKRLLYYREKYFLSNADLLYLNPQLLYLKALEMDPLHLDAYLGLAGDLSNDQTISLNHHLMTGEDLCLKVMKESPNYSQGYSSLAKLLSNNTTLLEKYGAPYFKELLLKALELDPCNIQAYITLYEGWNLVAEENATLLFAGKRYQKEDLLIKAITLSPHDLELNILYKKESLLKDPGFLSFLEKLSLAPLSSKGKLLIYEQLLTAVFYQEGMKNQAYEYIKALIAVIRKEPISHLHPILPSKNLHQVAKFACDQVRQIWHIPQSDSIIMKGFSHAWSARLWAKSLCFEHKGGLAYVRLAQMLSRGRLDFMAHYESHEKLKIRPLLYLTAIDINPELLAGYWSLYVFLRLKPSEVHQSSQQRQLALHQLFNKHSQVSPKKLIKPVNQPIALTIPLINGEVLSKSGLCKKILTLAGDQIDDNLAFSTPGLEKLTLRDLIEMIHHYASEEISYDFFFKELEKRKIAPLNLTHCYLKCLRVELKIGITDLETRKFLIRLTQSLKRLEPIFHLEETAIAQTELFTLYPQMIHPLSSLEELTTISDEVWKEALETSPCNSYFYCNLARHLSAWMSWDQYHKHSSLFHSCDKNPFNSKAKHLHIEFIYGLYFKSLQLNPLNAWTYHYLAENLFMLNRYEPSYAHIQMEYLYLLSIYLSPKKDAHYLALLELSHGKERYEFLDGTSMTEQDLFIKVLRLNIPDQGDFSLIIKKDGEELLERCFYQDRFKVESQKIPELSEPQIEQYIRESIQHIQKEFSHAAVYFKHSSEQYPYIQYDTKTSKFCLSHYPLDYLSGTFQQITGKTTYFDEKHLSRWFHMNSLLLDNPLFGLELIEKSTITRSIKLKIYQALVDSIVECSFEDNISDSRTLDTFQEDYHEDERGKLYMCKLVADIALKIRRGEIIHCDDSQSKIKMHVTHYPSLKSMLTPSAARGFFFKTQSYFESHLINPIEDDEEFKKDEFEDLKTFLETFETSYNQEKMYGFIPLAISINEYLISLEKQELLTNGIPIRELYMKLFSFYHNNPSNWLFPDHITKALFYPQIANCLNEHERIQLTCQDREEMEEDEEEMKEEQENQLHFTSQIISLSQEQKDTEEPLSKVNILSKQDLYFKAIEADPSLKFAYQEMEKLLTEPIQVRMDVMPSKEELSYALEKELKVFAHHSQNASSSSQEVMTTKTMKPIVAKLNQIKNSRISVMHTFTSILDFYLKMIDLHPNQPYPYYFLAEQLRDGEEMTLMNKVTLTTHQLYVRSVQLSIEEPRAYYKVATGLRERGGVSLFDKKTVLSKLDLLISAFFLKEDSYFYLKELVWNLVKASQEKKIIRELKTLEKVL